MKRRVLNITTWSLIACVMVLSFNNCSQIKFGKDDRINHEALRSYETIVGNPLAAKTIVSKVCNVITHCNTQVTFSQCSEGVLQTPGIGYQLGLSQDALRTFDDILVSETSGTLTANQSALNSCNVAIDNLPCSSSEVQGAYNPTTSNPFAGVTSMIPTSPGSCPAIFNQSPARNEYYVSPTGNDSNNGSVGQPWATITNASKKLELGAQGAIVHVAPGNYTFAASTDCITPAKPCSVVTHRSGTAEAPITYISDQQWAAKIIPMGTNTAWYNSGNYVKIIGFEIAGTSDTEFGILSEGAYGQIIGNHIHDIPVTKNCAASNTAGAIYFGWFAKTHDNDAIGNLIHDIGPSLPDGLPASSYCRFANGINVEQPGGKIQNNIIYRIANWGIETWNASSNLQISHNLIFNSGSKTNMGLPRGGGVLVGADASIKLHSGTTVSNNIFRNNRGSGLGDSNADSNNTYINNNLFSNGADFTLASGIAPLGTVLIDPLMADFKADGSGNYRLQQTSPIIDAGTIQCLASTGDGNCTPTDDFTGFARPHGGALDIGPFEWH